MRIFAYHASLLSSSGPERTSAQQTGQYEQVQVAFTTACRWHLQGRWQANGGIVPTVIHAKQPLLRSAFSYASCRCVLEGFKTCFVMNLHYCHGDRSLWVFVQKAVYYVVTAHSAHDNSPSNMIQLLADTNFRRNAT